MLAAVREDGDILLERRPENGVWGGLWCLPEFASASAAADYARQALQGAAAQPVALAAIEHAFTHFDLVITPLLAHCSGSAGDVPLAVPGGPDSVSGRSSPRDPPNPAPILWYRVSEPTRLGLPAPIRLLLEKLGSAGGLQAQLFD